MYKVYQLIYKKIQESLKSYIKGGEIQEKTSFQSIEITLTDVHIKKSALHTLMVPFVIQNTSKVKKIKISISHAPKLKLVVEGLHLVITPSHLKHVNSDYLQDLKFKKLEKWEQNQRDSLNAAGTFSKKLLDWLLPNLLTRVKVELKNFTLIYQDNPNIQILGFPSLFIFKLESFSVKRSENDWEKKGSNSVNVQVQLSDISVILRCDPIHYEKGTSVDSIYDEMKISERSYLLRPCSLEGSVNVSNESGNTLFSLSLKALNDIHLAINEFQSLFIEGFINFIETSQDANRYAFLKPKVPAKAAPENWWKFLIASLKHDLRFNMSKIMHMQNIKSKYIELYKRMQRVIQAPVLLKLSPSEEKEIRKIEENCLYEEIIEFRTQALEQLKKKINQDKTSYSSKLNKEEVKKIFKEYYGDTPKGPDIVCESAEESSEELETLEIKNKLCFSLLLPRLVFSVNLLKNPSSKKKEFIDTSSCKCLRCVPSQKDSEVKPNRGLPFKRTGFYEVPERDHQFTNRNTSTSRLKQEFSLLPNRKMKDIVIEYGDEIFTVGNLCYKTRLGDAYEANIIKEQTLVIFLLDDIKLGLTGTKDLLNCDININSNLTFDPLLLTCQSFDPNSREKVKSFKDLLSYSSWFYFIFLFDGDKRAHWSLRHFMKDQNALQEFEFWVHYYELITGKDLCLCGNAYKNEQVLKDVFMVNEQNPMNCIHMPEFKRVESSSSGFNLVKETAMKIQKNIVKYFPDFLQVGIRHFISNLFPVMTEQNPVCLKIEFAKDKPKGAFLEQYASRFEVHIENIPVYLSTTGVSYFKLFASPEKTGMQQKSMFQKNFVETLEDLPKRLMMIKSIFSHTEQSDRMLEVLTRTKIQKLHGFTLDVSVRTINLSLTSLISAGNLKNPANVTVRVSGIKIEKDVASSFRESETESRISSQGNIQNYIVVKGEVQRVSVLIPSELLLADDFRFVVNLSPFKNHPTNANVLLDVHLGTLRVKLDKNLVSLIHVLNSLDFQTTSNEIASFNEFGINDIRQNDSDFRNELKQAIDYFQDKEQRAKSKGMESKKFPKEKTFKVVKKNFIEEALNKHELPNENCKHCVLLYLKVLICVNFSIGSMNKEDPLGIVISLKESETTYFEVICKHLLAKIEESPIVSKTYLICSKIIGKSSAGDSLIIKPGAAKQKIQPLIKPRFFQFFPLTQKLYYGDGDVSGYLLMTLSANLFQFSDFGIDQVFDIKKSAISGVKGKIPEIDVNENEQKADINIDSVLISLSLQDDCRFIKGVSLLLNWVKLATSIVKNVENKLFVVKKLQSISCVKVNSIKISSEIGDLDLEIFAYNLELVNLPIAATPPLAQLLFKGKETELALTYQKTLKISSITMGIHNLLQVFIKNFDLNVQETRESKAKVINKVFICVAKNVIEKLEIKIQSAQIFSNETLLVSIPGEFSKKTLIMSKGKLIEIRNDKNNILHVSIPQTGILFHTESVKEILKSLLVLPKPDLKLEFSEEDFIKDSSLLNKKHSESRLYILISDLYLNLNNKNYIILTLKLHSINVFRNLPKDLLDKNNFGNIKELADDRSLLYSNPDEISVLVKNLEVSPNGSIHKKMIELTKDYSFYVKVDTKIKKILVFSTQPVKAVIINKVLDELILTIKDIKTVKPKKSSPDKDNFTVEISLKGGDVFVPRHSQSQDLLRAHCEEAKIFIYTGDKYIAKPTEATEETPVLMGKEVIHDEYRDPGQVFCDLVNIRLTSISCETFIQKKRKDLGKVENITVDVASPFTSEELVMFGWKTDSIVDVKFRDAEIKASLSYFLKLQKMLEENFDEEITIYPKIKKLQKLNLNFGIEHSEIEIQALEVLPKEAESEEIKSELVPSHSAVEFISPKRIEHPLRANSSHLLPNALRNSRIKNEISDPKSIHNN